MQSSTEQTLLNQTDGSLFMFSAAQIVRAQWVLFPQAAGVLPDNAVVRWRIGLLGALDWAVIFLIHLMDRLQLCREEVSDMMGRLAVCTLGM